MRRLRQHGKILNTCSTARHVFCSLRLAVLAFTFLAVICARAHALEHLAAIPLQLEHLAALRLELRLDALCVALRLLVQRLDAVLQHLVRVRVRVRVLVRVGVRVRVRLGLPRWRRPRR